VADQIIQCLVEKDGSDIIQYNVSYVLEYETHQNSFCIVIHAEDMVDPTDQAEAITKANVQAKVIKDAWVADLPALTSEVTISEPQSVTLE